MKNTLQTFAIGDLVDAEPWAGDIFDSFRGRIISRRGEYLVVLDQEGCSWDCLPAQLTPVSNTNEQQRRDEKNGLYGEHIDIAN